MKKADIAMIVLIATISVVTSIFLAKMVFGDVYKGTAQVKTIEKITSDIEKPNGDIFNKGAINPTVQVDIVKTDSITTDDIPTDTPADTPIDPGTP